MESFLSNKFAESHLGQTTTRRSNEVIQQYQSLNKDERVKSRSRYKYATNVLWQVRETYTVIL